MSDRDGTLETNSNHRGMQGAFVPFQYYATTGEANDDSLPTSSENEKYNWDQRMDEAWRFPNFVERCLVLLIIKTVLSLYGFTIITDKSLQVKLLQISFAVLLSSYTKIAVKCF